MNSPIIAYRANMGVQTSAPFANTYSLDFDAVDGYIDCGNSTVFNLTNTMTLSAWINPSIATADDFIIAKRWTSNAYQMATNAANRPSCSIWIGGVRYNALGTTTLTPGTWYNIIVTFDGLELKIYTNGVLEGTTSASGTIDINTDSLTIGKGLNSTIYNFNGLIDEVAIFDTDQSANVSTIYNSGIPTDLTDLSPTVWLRMGDNGAWKSPQWLIPNNENFVANKVSNYSFELDGIDDYIDCGNPTDLQITGAFTLSVWTKLDSTVGVQSCILSKDNGTSQRAFSFWGKIVNKPVFYIWNGATSYNVGGTTNIADNTWHHVAVVYVPSTSIRIYVDGVLEGTNTTSIPASINNAVYDFKIGHFAGSLFEYKGLMDEVSVFDSDQSANIATLYNSGTPTTLPSGAVAHWRMGEEATFSGGVWTIPDQVGSNNGTSNAMTIEDRVGEAPSSENNAVSYNMDEEDREIDTP